MSDETKKQDSAIQQKSLNANNQKNEEVKLDPLAFAPQIFLLDLFSEDSGISGLKLQKTPNSANKFSPNVPKLQEGQLDRVNSILDLNFKKIADFINTIPTNEIAQLVPEINMFIIDSLEPSRQLQIPLSDPATLNKSQMGSLGYYSGNTIGLSSMEMTLDGNRNPAFNKAYLVKMNFVLDSINTFTDPIPGGNEFGGLTYADIFRSGGSPGSLNDRFFIKLAISHAASPNNNILEKYGLHSDDMTFSLSLTLRESTFGVGENLKTTVDVTFTGYEENLYERKDLFDFLSLDLRSAKVELKNKINKAKNTFSLAKATAEERAKKFTEIAKENYDQEFKDANNKFASKYFGGDAAAAKNYLKYYKNPRDAQRRSGVAENSEKSKLAQTIYKDVLSYKKRSDIRQSGKGGYFSFIQLAAAADDLTYDIPERFKTFNNGIEIEKNNAIGKAKADFDRINNVEKAKLDNIRMNEISRVLETAFFGKEYYDAGIIKTIQVTSEQLQNYFRKQKDGGFSPENSIKTLEGTDSKDAANVKESTPNPTQNTITPNEPDHKKIEEVKENLKKKDAEIARKETIFNVQNIKQEDYEKDDSYKKLIEEKNNLQQQLKDITQFSQTLGGSVQDILDKLNNYKQFDYILLGDLLRLTFNKLFDNILMDQTKDTGTGGFEVAFNALNVANKFAGNVQTKILSRTRLLLTDIVIPKAGQTNINITRNLFDMPISVKNLKFLFADKIFGKSKNNYTLFELIGDIANLISVSFQNKAILLNDTSPKRKYSIHKASYSLKGENPNFTIISSKYKTPDLKHGVVIYFRSTEENFKRDTSYSSNVDNKIPHLYFGGYDRGAVKKVELTLHQKDNMQLAVMESLGGTAGKIIPAFFKSRATLIACPIFHLGMEYYVATPTINSQGENPWLYSEGYYGVNSVTHSYRAGGPFETVVEGMRLNSKQDTKDKTAPIKVLTADEAKKLALQNIEDGGVLDEYEMLRQQLYMKDLNRSVTEALERTKKQELKEDEEGLFGL